MSYLKNIDKVKYDPELIKTIQRAAGINIEGVQNFEHSQFGFANDKVLKFSNQDIHTLNMNNMTPEKAEKIARIRKAIRAMSLVIAKIIIGSIVEKFVDNKVNNFAIKVIAKKKENENLIKFLNKEITEVYNKHPEYKTCTLEQFKKTSIYEYIVSEWRDKNINEIALQARKHAFNSAIMAFLAEAIPIPGSTILMYPIKAALHYLGFNIGTSITELIISFNSHCLSMGINLRPIGYILNNITLYSFKDKNKLVATNLKDPPEDLYKITNEDAKRILKKYEDSALINRDIDLIYSKK